MLQPFTDQTFRCSRCGSPAGPTCRCWEAQAQSQAPEIDLPQLQPPVSRPIMLDLGQPAKPREKR